ncbi:MAG: hypothetical protein RIQ62_560 [Bacteroidota bacterium]|jgi:hypothetical protein
MSHSEYISYFHRKMNRKHWIVGALVVIVLLFIFIYPPETYPYYPTCLFHKISGWDCPFCGGTRCVSALLRAHWFEALGQNALVVICLVLLLLILILRRLFRKPTLGKFIFRPLFIFFVLALFMLLRNIPYWPFSLLASQS